MSATVTSTITTPKTAFFEIPSAMTTVTTVSETHCPTCGGMSDFHDSSEARRRIQELEGQVEDLTERATATATKLADYEEEVRQLRTSQIDYDTPRSSSSLPPPPPQTQELDRALSPTGAQAKTLSPEQCQQQQQQNTYQSRLSQFTSLLPYRRGSSTTQATSQPPTTPTTAPINPLAHQVSPASNTSDNAELQDALYKEQGLRKAAESQLTQANTELEELTVQLFSQANEMVAQERKARAKLEERVAILERRDIEKRSRLERLEKSMARVERLKALVNS